MHYCLVINTHGNQQEFCKAMDHVIGKSTKTLCPRLQATLNNYFFNSMDRVSKIGMHFLFLHYIQTFLPFSLIISFFTDSKRGTALACTGRRTKHTFTGLIPNKKYFVNVFGIQKSVPGLIFPLANTSFVFNCTNLVELREDQMEIGRVSEFDKRSTFIFKVIFF